MGRYLWYRLSLTFHISRLKKVQPCKTSNKHTQCNFKLLKLNLLSPVVVRLHMGDTYTNSLQQVPFQPMVFEKGSVNMNEIEFNLQLFTAWSQTKLVY